MTPSSPQPIPSGENPALSSPPPSSSLTWQQIVAIIGIPCIISVAAIDPGNLEVDMQAGSANGYSLLWALLFSSVIGFFLQALAAHLTVFSGLHLAELYARAYKHDDFLFYSLFGIAELSIIAFDVAEVVGTAFALQILFDTPLWIGMLLSALDTTLVLILQRKGLTKVEIIVESLLFILAGCLIYNFILSRPALDQMLIGSIQPSLGDNPQEGAILAVGLLGSIVMAHNLFLHSWLVNDREKEKRAAQGAYHQPTSSELATSSRYATFESAAIFFATFLINACVVAIAATIPKDQIPENLGLRNSGVLLQNVLGTKWAASAWGLALLASGHAATVTGTLASQAVCEGFLDIREGQSSFVAVLGVRAAAIIPAVCVGLLENTSSTDSLVVLSQVLLSLALPFAVIPMFKIFSEMKRRHHGDIKHWMIIVGYASLVVLVGANVFVVFTMVADLCNGGSTFGSNFMILILCAATYLIYRLFVTPVQLDDYELAQDQAYSREVEEYLLLDTKP